MALFLIKNDNRQGLLLLSKGRVTIRQQHLSTLFSWWHTPPETFIRHYDWFASDSMLVGEPSVKKKKAIFLVSYFFSFFFFLIIFYYYYYGTTLYYMNDNLNSQFAYSFPVE